MPTEILPHQTLNARSSKRSRRVLYLQYNNPAAYPPILHSANIMRAEGYKVYFLGAVNDATRPIKMSNDCDGLTLLSQPSSGIALKLFFVWFMVRAFIEVLRLQPSHLYVSDPAACPATVLIKAFFRPKTIYHEHDAPSPRIRTIKEKILHSARRSLVRNADFCVVPNSVRAAAFTESLRPKNPVFVIWNCPGQEEISQIPDSDPSENPKTSMRIFYAGSLNYERLPISLLNAMVQVPGCTLHLIGYETVGSAGFVDSWMDSARELGIKNRVEYLGTLPERKDVLRKLATANVALALMPMSSEDINMNAMAGASNKAFDALACGVPILVSNLPDWKEGFVDKGVAISCDPRDVGSMVNAFQWCHAHPEKTLQMGEIGRSLVQEQWNYQAQFSPLLEKIRESG